MEPLVSARISRRPASPVALHGRVAQAGRVRSRNSLARAIVSHGAMTPLPFVFPYALLFWATIVWAFLPEFGIVRRAKRSVAEGGSRDAGSLRVIMMGMN